MTYPWPYTGQGEWSSRVHQRLRLNSKMLPIRRRQTSNISLSQRAAPAPRRRADGVDESGTHRAAMEDVLGPAHNAAFQGDGDSLRGLALANLMAVGADGRTPAHIAAMEGHASFLLALHELGAEATLSVADANGKTPAIWAAMRGHVSCLHALHELGAAASLSAAAANGWTPAHDAAFQGHASCLHALHELGSAASLSAAAADGWTPAHLAAMEGHASCLHALHELGAAASLSAASANGWTPLHDAAFQGHASCLHALHELGAGASLVAAAADGSTPLHDAAGQPPGHADSERNYVRCIRFLLQAGADIDQIDGFGNTPLLLAARQGHLLNVQELCLHGANRELAGAPTAIQVSAGYPTVCRWLRRTRDHTSPLHYLELLSASQCKALLRAGGRVQDAFLQSRAFCSLQRGPGTAGYEAAQLVAATCMPWHAASHSLWPASCRARAWELLAACYQLAYRRNTQDELKYGNEAAGLKDALVSRVLAYGLDRTALERTLKGAAVAVALTTSETSSQTVEPPVARLAAEWLDQELAKRAAVQEGGGYSVESDDKEAEEEEEEEEEEGEDEDEDEEGE
jgi:ankyrin repeat protein